MDGEEEQKRSAGIGINDENDDDGNDSCGDKGRTKVEDMSLLSITDGENGRGIPVVKFIDDVEEFANSFQPMASAELIIGAYSELHQKFKTFETTLTQKKHNYLQKIPDLEKSLSLVKSLQEKQQKGGDDAITTARYNLADNVYGKAEVDCSVGIVNLWLGANVMLEYTYEEAIEFLTKNLKAANDEFEMVKDDLMFVRDQIVTSEVSMSRVFNWDVRRKRVMDAAAVANKN